MADISKEIKDFREAVYGEEVRDSMVSLAEKINRVNEDAARENAEAVKRADAATGNAVQAAETAGKAAAEADRAAERVDIAIAESVLAANNAAAIRDELQNKLENEEFTGPAGPPGPQGEQGISGVTAPASGMFALEVDSATGDLYALYPDGGPTPDFEYDTDTGELYYVIN